MSATGQHGWPFMVARGRDVGYGLLLAPGFVLDTGSADRLVAVVQREVPAADPPVIAAATVPGMGRVGVAYRTRRVTLSDIGPGGPAEPVLDGVGRPLVIAFGFVCPHARVEHIDEQDLDTAWQAAVRTYGRFHTAETAFAGEISEPFPLASTTRPDGADRADPVPARATPTATPWSADPLSSRRPPVEEARDGGLRRVLVTAGMIALTATATAGLALMRRTAPVTTETGTLELTICSTTRDTPDRCRADTVELVLDPVAEAASTPRPTALRRTVTLTEGRPTIDTPTINTGSYRVPNPTSGAGRHCTTAAPPGTITITANTPTRLTITCTEP